MPRQRGPFLALMAANAISQVGNMMTAVAVPWLVLQTTGSAAAVGLTGAAIAVGWVAPAILGGPLVDRLGLRRTSISADLISGAAVASIPVLGLLGVLAFWEVMVLIFALSSFDALGVTARFAVIPGLATRASFSLERANAADRAIARAGQLIGPVLAGVLIAWIGPSNVLFVDAGTFVVSALLVAFGVSAMTALQPVTAEAKATAGYRAALSEGLRFVLGNRLVLSLIVLALLGNVFDVPLMTVVLPVYAKEIFDSPTSLGLMVGAFAGGALAGTILFGAIGRGWPRRPLLLGGWFVAVLVGYGALAARLPLGVIVLAGLIGGIAAGPINPILETVLQENTPPQLMGRVFGAFLALAQAGIPIGAAIAGFVIEDAQLIPTIAGVGAVYVALIALMFLNPALRLMDKPAAIVGEQIAEERTQLEPAPQARRAATMKAGL
jgi:MFS family permease